MYRALALFIVISVGFRYLLNLPLSWTEEAGLIALLLLPGVVTYIPAVSLWLPAVVIG